MRMVVCYNIGHRVERGGMLTEEERKRRQKESRRRYDFTKTKQYVMRLRLGADADVIERLDSVKSKTEYIRSLIRKDMARGA